MQLKLLVFVSVILAAPVATALANDHRFFAGMDVTGGMASASSDTTNGGAAFAGGGIVNQVKFGPSKGIGGHIGYKITPAMAVFLSYQHIKGDIRWNADFPLLGVTSKFKGSAISNALMGNIAYEFPLSNAVSIQTTAGMGASFNTLSEIRETDKGTGIFLADVANHTTITPVAQVGTGIQYKIAPNTALAMDASVAYSGGFETGDTRNGNLGVTGITPYKIDDVWRANLGISFRFEF